MPAPRPYRILSLDGGGTWALIQVRALQNLYGPRATGHKVLKNFDLVVANSGGSIVAAGLFLNLSLGEIAQLFKDKTNREAIFHRPDGLGRLRRIPRYEADEKVKGLWQGVRDARPNAKPTEKAALRRRFKTLTMHEAWEDWNDPELPHFLILGYDYLRDQGAYFRTNRRSLAGTGGAAGKTHRNPSFLEAIHASSNAPVIYFDAPAKITSSQGTKPSGKRANSHNHVMWDGAIAGYNNPIVAGVTEAIANGTTIDSISAISIGTASDQRPFKEDFHRHKTFSRVEEKILLSHGIHDIPFIPDMLAKDVVKLSTAVLANPPDIASYTAHTMIGGSIPGPGLSQGDWPIIRLNPVIAPKISGDGKTAKLTVPSGLKWRDKSPAKTFEMICDLDMDATASKDVELIEVLAENWIAGNTRNQPVIATGLGGRDAHIGDTKFAAARARAHRMGFGIK